MPLGSLYYLDVYGPALNKKTPRPMDFKNAINDFNMESIPGRSVDTFLYFVTRQHVR